ncbi:MAG: hypothetical protein IPQ07_41745 [Myxococcales bacterium]|nr:hypothetical protein [Myxococcales bacterium]
MMRSVLVASLVLVGCRGGEKPAADQTASTSSSTTSEPPTKTGPATTRTSPTTPTTATTTAKSVNEMALERMHEFADAMCACADVACAKRVSAEQAEWAYKLVTENPNLPKKSADEMKRTREIATQMATCMTRAMNDSP